ncbi:MAG: hydroxyacid dehydrogenase [Rhodospirillaceae bacterium]|nr:hydroxyacid dehydrogenase [Rhodospirillaceae bacterium]
MPKVIIHDAIDEAGVDLLKSRADLEICEVARDDDETLRREIADADGLILRYLPLRAEALKASNRLKVVARHGVGCDNVDVDAATARKIPIATVGDANAVAVAELTLFFMLAASKRARHYDEAVRRGDFLARETADHLELYGRTVLLLGFGRIAQKVAARCRAFEMTVECCDPYVPQQDIVDAGCMPVADLADALPRADYVSVHVPLNEETHHLLDKEALARMKQGAILVNAARGPIVDGRALYEALESGHLAGAGLDVFEEEPPRLDDPLLSHPATVLMPHMGGSSRGAFIRMATQCAQHVLDALDGRLDSSFVINPEALD